MNSNFINKEDELLSLLNDALKLYPLMHYNDFNYKQIPISKSDVFLFEKKNPKLGITKNGELTIISLISTITDVLCNKRLSIILNEEKYIIGFTWFKG